MDGYIKKSEAVDVIVKYPYNLAGKTATAIKMIEDLPSADVVPREELELSQHLLNGAHESIEELGKWYKKLQHKYNLAVAEREANVKGFTEELEKAKAEVDRLKYNLKAVLEEIPETKREFASEIFAEIEKEIDRGLSVIEKILNTKGGRANGKTVLLSKYDVYREAKKYIVELKKKYTEGNQ